MEKRIGTFYGVSVGPGDPELMTLQAVRRLENCPVIAAPQTPKGGMLALDIAKGAVELSGKTILPLRFAMSLDPAAQKLVTPGSITVLQPSASRISCK